MPDNVYLDYQATTPLAPQAFAAMQPWLTDHYGNPHSAHKMGRKASAVVELARAQVAAIMPTGKITFTSGATEALNLAILGSLQNCSIDRNKIIALPSEHAAVLDVLRYVGKYGIIDNDRRHRHFELVMAPLQSDGLINMDHLAEMIDDQTALVTAMLVNNEIGVIQPIEAVADLAHNHGAMMLCDMVQGYGRVPIPVNVDMAAISAHKIYGPKGIGALWIRAGVHISPIQHGGGQESGLRSGTLSPALCAGFGTAADLMQNNAIKDEKHIKALWDKIMPIVGHWAVNGSRTARYLGNVNMRMDGLDVARLMSDLRHIAFSAGSACASGSGRTSHVLAAIGLSETQAKNSIRLGTGRYTEMDQWVEAIQTIDKMAKDQVSGI